jgi:hypothetical protein
MPLSNKKKLEGSPEGQSDAKVDVFPDHLRIKNLEGYNVRIDANGAKASKEIKDFRVRLATCEHDKLGLVKGDLLLGKYVPLPSLNLEVRFSLDEISKIASLKPSTSRDNEIFVRISAKFQIDNEKVNAEGMTLGDSRCSVEKMFFASEPKGPSRLGWTSLYDGIVLDDAFREKLAGEIRLLAEKLDDLMKNNSDASLFLKKIKDLEEAEDEKFIQQSIRFAVQLKEISDKYDVFNNPNTMFPVAADVMKNSKEWLSMVQAIRFHLNNAANSIRTDVKAMAEGPGKAELEKEAEKLEKLGKLFEDYTIECSLENFKKIYDKIMRENKYLKSEGQG